MKHAFLKISIMLALVPSTSAQDAPLKWGDIPEEHLQMRSFPADTNASAVILADYGDVHFNPDFSVVFKHHRRIKILSESGYDWGTVDIGYYGKDRTQLVQKIKGQTITVGADGKAIRHGLDKKAIFQEDLNGEWRRVRFALPALTPGAVVEYEYEVVSESPIYMPGWQFQMSEPVLWSEFRAKIPQELQYVSATKGVRNYAVQESEEVYTTDGQVMRHRWAMQDVAALREEPFMTTPSDYRAGIEFQLKAYRDHYTTQPFMTTWEVLAEELMEAKAFGGQLGRHKAVRQQAAAITAGLEDPLAKVQALYDYVRSTITWNQGLDYFPNQSLEDVLRTKSGNSGEIALLLVALLREAGLEAHPVLISTRDHGHIIEIYPLLSQFNDVLAYVKAGEQGFLLDATDPLRPYDLLPVSALNGKGWLVREKAPQWIPIEAKGRYLHQAYVRAELDSAGVMKGAFYLSDDAYAALERRGEMQEHDVPEDFIREVALPGMGQAEVDSCTVEDEEGKPFKVSAAFSIPSYGQAAGGYIYFNPTLIDRQDENPLHLPERTFPVDLAYPRHLVYTLQLHLPKGYEVQELPSSAKIHIPSGGGRFIRAVETREGMLTVQSRFELSKVIFEPQRYQELRSFFDRIVAAHAEQVVLKRVEPVTTDASGVVSGGDQP